MPVPIFTGYPLIPKQPSMGMGRTWKVKGDFQIFSNARDDHAIAPLRSTVVCGVDTQNLDVVEMVVFISSLKSLQMSR